MKKRRAFFSNGIGCVVDGVCAVSLSDDHRIFVNNGSGDPIISMRCATIDEALGEIVEFNRQLPDMQRRVVLGNGCNCLIDAIFSHTVTDDHRVLLKGESGALLCSIKFGGADEALDQLKKINSVFA